MRTVRSPAIRLLDNYSSTNHRSNGGAISNLPFHLDGYTCWNNRTEASSALDLWNPGNNYNFAVTQANMIGYKTAGSSSPTNAYVEGFGVDVFPGSLYEAQVQRRLIVLPAWVKAAKDEYADFVNSIVNASGQSSATAGANRSSAMTRLSAARENLGHRSLRPE